MGMYSTVNYHDMFVCDSPALPGSSGMLFAIHYYGIPCKISLDSLTILDISLPFPSAKASMLHGAWGLSWYRLLDLLLWFRQKHAFRSVL